MQKCEGIQRPQVHAWDPQSHVLTPANFELKDSLGTIQTLGKQGFGLVFVFLSQPSCMPTIGCELALQWLRVNSIVQKTLQAQAIVLQYGKKNN